MTQKLLAGVALAAALLGGGLAVTVVAEGTSVPAAATPDAPTAQSAAPVSAAAPALATSPGGEGAAADPTEGVSTAAAGTTREGPDGAMEARRKAYEERLEQLLGGRAPRPERPVAPEGVPSRQDIDRYVEKRRQEVDAQLRATDPWGQYRRDWREGWRQHRRDARDLLRAAPGFPAYPWGPVAPYYGSAWGEPLTPTVPSREAMDEFFQRQHQAIELQHRQLGPWTPYTGAFPGGRGPLEERMLLQNPWVPSVTHP